GGFVVEAQFPAPRRDVVGQLGLVAGSLLGHATEGDAGLLGLDHAAGFATDEQQVVAGAGPGLELAHGHAFLRIAVEVGVVLDDPASSAKQRVDPFARQLFRCLRHHPPPGAWIKENQPLAETPSPSRMPEVGPRSLSGDSSRTEPLPPGMDGGSLATTATG